MITYQELRELLRYEPDTGKWFWKVKISRNRAAGDETGKPDVTGYCHIRYKRRLYKAHRLAWLYMTGEWPEGDIDHRDLNPSNNRWKNLRDATKSQNLANSKKYKNNKSGFKGVCKHSQNNSWVAEIRKNNKKISLGCFATKEEAAEAYVKAAQEIHGEFANY
jgi:hypothetical protein